MEVVIVSIAILVSLYDCTAVQSQKTVSAYFTSKQILSFDFAEQCSMIDLLTHSCRSLPRDQ